MFANNQNLFLISTFKYMITNKLKLRVNNKVNKQLYSSKTHTSNEEFDKLP